MAVDSSKPADRGFLSFFTNWSMSKGTMFLWLGLWGFWVSFCTEASLPVPEWFKPVVIIALFISVWIWLSNDGQRFPEEASHYGGLALFVVWPLLLPVYVLETRGWRRVLAVAVFTVVTVLGSIVVGELLGDLLKTR